VVAEEEDEALPGGPKITEGIHGKNENTKKIRTSPDRIRARWGMGRL